MSTPASARELGRATRRAAALAAAAAAAACAAASRGGSCCALLARPARRRARCSSRATRASTLRRARLRDARCAPSSRCARARFYRQLLRGSVGLCESYMDGLWECDDLVALTRIAALNVRRARPPAPRARARADPRAALGALARAQHARTRAPAIAAHYDLGNELFALFLDETMMYSCAVFERPDATLAGGLAREARARLRASSTSRPEDHVLEIGTGWGGFAVYAAEHYGCRVTTTTISREQHAYARRARARGGPRGPRDRAARGLPRARRARYDKLVSIEMIEAVGWQYFPTLLPPLLGAAAPTTARCCCRRS